jgi:hypothetical protein
VTDFVVLHQLVDRILQQQKARRKAAEKAEREEAEKAKLEEVAKVGAETSASSISKLLEMTLHDSQTKILITQTNVSLPSASTVIAVPGTSKRLRLTSAIHELGRHLQRNPASGETVQSQTVPTTTSLSNIGMSLENSKSGFHLVFHCI